MDVEIKVTLGKGKKVDARIGKHLIPTDQSVEEGGQDSSPSPLMYCLASMGTCAAVYVQSYLEARDLPTQGVRLVQTHVFDEKLHRITGVKMDIRLPPEIPEKHHKPIVRAAGLCTVKKLFENPPEFEVGVTG